MSPILNSLKWVPHYGNTHFLWVDSPRNDIFKIRQKMSGHFEPFPVLGSIRNGQIWVLHYQKVLIPIEFLLLALEMNFSHFWKTRAFFLKNRHFQSFPVMQLIWNGQIWILYHHKPCCTHFCGSGSTRNDIYTI